MDPAKSTIWTSPHRDYTELVVQGRSVVDRASEFESFLSANAGRDAANLFAEPRPDPNGDVQWFDRLGATTTRPLRELSPSERSGVEERLRSELAKVERLQGDPRFGALVSSALVLERPDAIRVAGDRPILAGWGLLPRGVVTSDGIRTHHEQTLGPFLSLTDPPVQGLGSSVTSVIPDQPPSRLSRAAIVATLIAAVILLVLLLPGVLLRLYPPSIATADPRSRNSDEINLALENEIRIRRRQLEGDVCVPRHGALPRIEPGPPTTPDDGPRGSAVVPPESDISLTPPVQPSQTPVPSEVAPGPSGQPSNLAQLLQDATVLVWTDNGFGSGFFVSPTLVLSNRHVIEKSSETIHVGNRKLGQMVPVQLVAMTPNSDLGQPDYALLKLTEGQGPTFLSIAGDVPSPLQNVIAAGYPRIVMSTDDAFYRLRRGDSSAIPDIALTDGTVVVVQNRRTKAPIILHRASISPGNSGGPLVDECGRVVGVNTFVRSGTGTDASDRMHYSLSALSAIEFARHNGATPNVVDGRCVVSPASNTPP